MLLPLTPLPVANFNPVHLIFQPKSFIGCQQKGNFPCERGCVMHLIVLFFFFPYLEPTPSLRWRSLFETAVSKWDLLIDPGSRQYKSQRVFSGHLTIARSQSRSSCLPGQRDTPGISHTSLRCLWGPRPPPLSTPDFYNPTLRAACCRALL